MKILVTGADGFIGKNVVRKLTADGHQIIALTRADGDISNCVLNIESLDHVIHLAGRTFVPESWKNPYEFYQSNFMGTANVLEFCRRFSYSLTYVSSYVYGVPQFLPIHEEHPLHANSPYNHSKLVAEDLCRFYAREYRVKVTVLRPFNVYGPGQRSTFLVPHVLEQLLNSEKATIEIGNPKPKRDYIYIDDFVEAVIATFRRSEFGVFNVGSGRSYSVEQLIEIAERSSGIKKTIQSSGVERNNEIMDVVADISKIQRELNWSPKISLENGLSEMVRLMINKGRQ